MVLKLIACEVFYREVCLCVATSPHRVDLEFTEKNAHERSDFLRSLVQSKIDAAESGGVAYDAILLGFGLCGNGVLGAAAKKTPLVLPRAHDCCTIFLGSRRAFKEHFSDNPSLPFSSVGYMERGGTWIHDASAIQAPGLDKNPRSTVAQKYEEYAALYGAENAKYIMETLTASRPNNKIVFIEVPELSHLGFAEKAKAEAMASGREFVQLPGDMRLIRKLVHGDWDAEEFLVLKPGQKIGGVYDWDEIVRAEEDV
jgi:hypothetical protein